MGIIFELFYRFLNMLISQIILYIMSTFEKDEPMRHRNNLVYHFLCVRIYHCLVTWKHNIIAETFIFQLNFLLPSLERKMYI